MPKLHKQRHGIVRGGGPIQRPVRHDTDITDRMRRYRPRRPPSEWDHVLAAPDHNPDDGDALLAMLRSLPTLVPPVAPVRPRRFIAPSDEYDADGDAIMGSGFLSAAKNFFKPIRKQAPPKVRDFVGRNKDKKVISVEVGKTPVLKPVQKFLDVLSGGKYEKKKKELGYDDLYHTFLVVTLEDGRKYKIEKNSSVEVHDWKPQAGKFAKIPMKEPVELDKFLEKGEYYFKNHPKKSERGENFWSYDKTNNNCQYFVDDIIKGNSDALQPHESLDSWVKQDSAEISKSINSSIPDAILNLKQRIDHAVEGEGLHPGFSSVAKRIARREGVPLANADAILAASSRRASRTAHRRNPRLNRV